ncbi:hypothetical protein F5B21DRAFT_467705 [Xylaria acuta]|nr:hypothetical protein F5B21DRAFT_467705 [Xylaria acuta]
MSINFSVISSAYLVLVAYVSTSRIPYSPIARTRHPIGDECDSKLLFETTTSAPTITSVAHLSHYGRSAVSAAARHTRQQRVRRREGIARPSNSQTAVY